MLKTYLNRIMEPPIVKVNNEINRMKKEGKKIINLGQAVVNFFPDEKIIDEIHRMFKKIEFHYYSPDEGFYQLRELICRQLNKDFNSFINPEQECFVTSGANQAYFSALMALISPGDEILIPAPYYFNHVMAAEMLHGKVRLLNLTEETGFIPFFDQIKKMITEKTKVITLVSPNNPCGVVYPLEELKRIIEFCQKKGIFVIVDETYQFFHFEKPQSVASLLHQFKNLFIISSFSKSHCFAGWRLGYLIFPSEFKRNIYKIQDTIIISPPTVSQFALIKVFSSYISEIEKNKNTLIKRKNILVQELRQYSEKRIEPQGGCFYWYALPEGINGIEAAADLLKKKGVAVIPGGYFGNDYKQYWRISFGAADENTILNGSKLINSFLEEIR